MSRLVMSLIVGSPCCAADGDGSMLSGVARCGAAAPIETSVAPGRGRCNASGTCDVSK
jgi:hypothetical protein